MAETTKSKWLTLPNLITTLRILGSPGMILMARVGWTYLLLALTAFLVFTEWLDGFVARRLKVSSDVGARLDTIADAVFYSSLLVAIVILRPDLVGSEAQWIAVAVASYVLSWIVSLLKFRSLPSYHTWAAKGVWVVIAAGCITLLTIDNPLLFRIAMFCVVATNLEAICITLMLSRCKTDIPSFWHVMRNEPRRDARQ